MFKPLFDVSMPLRAQGVFRLTTVSNSKGWEINVSMPLRAQGVFRLTLLFCILIIFLGFNALTGTGGIPTIRHVTPRAPEVEFQCPYGHRGYSDARRMSASLSVRSPFQCPYGHRGYSDCS